MKAKNNANKARPARIKTAVIRQDLGFGLLRAGLKRHQEML
jgi:hypothetical protein